MAFKNGKSYWSVMTFCTQRCLGSLITNPCSTFKKFQIADLTWQTKMQNFLDWDDILYAGFLGSLIDAQISVIHKGGSNMADEKIDKLG